MGGLAGKHLHLSALQLKQTPEAPKEARQELDKLGPMSTNEKITAGALGLTVALWIFGSSVGINAVAAALVGALDHSNVWQLHRDDCAGSRPRL